MKTANLPELAAIGWGLLTLCASVAAQTAAPALAPSAPGGPTAALTPMQRAQRDADKVYYWIKLHGNLPAKAPAPKDAAINPGAKPAAANSAAVAKRPAPVARTTDPGPPASAAKPTATEGVTAEASEPSADRPSATPPQADAPAEAAAPAEPAAANTVAKEPAAEAQKPQTPEPPAAEPAAAPEKASPAAPADERLQAIAQPSPNFPSALIERLRRGSVRVQLNVLPDGSVANAEVLESSNARLNPVALAAVRQWRFKPVARAQVAQVELAFNLD